MPEKKLFKLFEKLGISYKNYEHEPVFTVKQGLHLQEIIPGAHSKNLFLRNKKKSYYCLVSIIEDKTVDLKQLSEILGHGRLSFCSSEDMLKLLNLTPGSVSPFGLINAEDKVINFILDQDFLKYDLINFHPLTNHMTVTLKTADFIKFLNHINHKFTSLSIPIK